MSKTLQKRVIMVSLISLGITSFFMSHLYRTTTYRKGLTQLHFLYHTKGLTQEQYLFYNNTNMQEEKLRFHYTCNLTDVSPAPHWLANLTRFLWTKRYSIPKEQLEQFERLISQEKPFGSWPPYDYAPLRNYLKPAYLHTKESGLKVPPLVHFTWFYKASNSTLKSKPVEMKFFQLISLIAAHKKIKPYKIIFWYDVMPVGQWWDYAVKTIPNLLLVNRETPTHIFNQSIRIGEHRSDVTRLEAVLALGGIYLDLDSVALNSFDPLRNYSACQGAPLWYSLANGILIGAPYNLFHWLFYLSYYDYRSDQFSSNSVMHGMHLAVRYPQLVHVEYKYLLRPNVMERVYYYKKDWLWDWSKHYSVHLYARFNPKAYEYESIHDDQMTVGEIYRYILWDISVANITERPSLFDVSWWHNRRCKPFPKGTWNCTEHEIKFARLNKTGKYVS